MPDLPPLPQSVGQSYPAVLAAYHALGAACATAGPLDERTARLVKLALSVGAASEGAVHSHSRRLLDTGATRGELEHVALLAITTLGFPRAMAALSWIRDVTERRDAVLPNGARTRRRSGSARVRKARPKGRARRR